MTAEELRATAAEAAAILAGLEWDLTVQVLAGGRVRDRHLARIEEARRLVDRLASRPIEAGGAGLVYVSVSAASGKIVGEGVWRTHRRRDCRYRAASNRLVLIDRAAMAALVAQGLRFAACPGCCDGRPGRGRSRLGDAEVRAIRRAIPTAEVRRIGDLARIARERGVPRQTVEGIASGRCYRWVD